MALRTSFLVLGMSVVLCPKGLDVPEPVAGLCGGRGARVWVVPAQIHQ